MGQAVVTLLQHRRRARRPSKTRLGSDLSKHGRLFLFPALTETLDKLSAHLASHEGLNARIRDEGCIVLAIGRDRIGDLASELRHLLTDTELRATAALYRDGGTSPTLSDFARVRTLADLVALGRGRWLRDLLDNGGLVSHLQPIALATDIDQTVAYEALLRGIKPSQPIISPRELFSAARDAGMEHELEVAAQACAFRAAGDIRDGALLFVNVCPLGLEGHQDTLSSFLAATRAVGRSPHQVVIELTETQKISDPTRYRTLLDRWREVGFRFALDDVASGYSGLNLLHQLEPEVMKLDMALIRDIHLSSGKALIATKLLEIAQTLGIATVAEGIESQGELDWVREHGATWVQGDYIAAPAALPTPLHR